MHPPNFRVWLCLIYDGGCTGPERGYRLYTKTETGQHCCKYHLYRNHLYAANIAKTCLLTSGDPQPVCASACEGVHSYHWGDSKHPSGFYISNTKGVLFSTLCRREFLFCSFHALLSRILNYRTLRVVSPTKTMALVLPWPTGRSTGAPPTTHSTSTRFPSITTY